MADILKITTPMVGKNNQLHPTKPAVDPTIPFDLQNIPRVVKTANQGEILKQNNGMIQKEDAPTILLNLLKDPGVSVNFLKNIFLLQEIVRLLPVNNQTMTEEIDQLFDALLLTPEEIVGEMTRQEDTSTAFRGEIFDFLRQLVSENPRPEVRYGVANLLKSISAYTGRQDVLDAVANSLEFLADSTESSRSLSEKLALLARQFRQEDAAREFQALKREVFTLLEEVENSILFNPKMEKVSSMLVYNLSRFNDNQDFLPESMASLLTLIDGRENKAHFAQLMSAFLGAFAAPEEQEPPSKVMDTLAKIIGLKDETGSLTLLGSEKVERIIHSLLSSPCNFTPLLHFVVPVQYQDLKSFAEIWVSPGGEGDGERAEGERTIHMLLVFDIEGIGQFEAELYVRDRVIDLSLFCPAAYAEIFSGSAKLFAGCAGASGYRFGNILVDKLERPRSLMDVFKSLPYKRTGVDVKI